MEELKLVKKAMKGNTKAYGQLIEQKKELLYRTAYLHVKNEQVALDLVSETIIKGYESIHTLREPAYFKTWLIRILLNNVKDYFKKVKDEVSYEFLEEFPDEKRTCVEEKLDLKNAIDTLPKKYQSVIILKYYEDMKISEIAEVLDIPEGTVKAYLHHGKEALKTCLKEDYLYV